MKFISFLFLVLCINPFQHSHEGIDITVRKKRRSIVYVAENTTNQDLDLFFIVESQGFRRRADRPMIKTIPAKTKVDLLEMTPLKNADTTHTYTAIVTQKENRLTIKKSDTLIKKIKRSIPDGN